MQARKKYFINHPSIEKMYFTADGLAFIEEGEAKSHAASIEDKKVTPVTREEAMAEKDGKEADPKDAAKKDADNAVKEAGKLVTIAQKSVDKAKALVEGKGKAVENAKPEKKEAAETVLADAKATLTVAETALTEAEATLNTATEARKALDEPAA